MVAKVQRSNNPDDRLLAQVRRARPDVLLIREANDDWIEALAPLAETMPHRRIHTTGADFGIALYSHLSLVSPEVRYLWPAGTRRRSSPGWNCAPARWRIFSACIRARRFPRSPRSAATRRCSRPACCCATPIVRA